MELLQLFGSEAQKATWLNIYSKVVGSAFAMTEPDATSSDPNNLATHIERDGDE